jgi:uroporphyrin-III C-methyltransferase/precorrin-2 dehydrogenase/sirohydrochlorin ferrochelatase
VQSRDLAFRARRRFWEAFTALALARPDAPPTEADRAMLLDALDRAEEATPSGSVVFAGAGPGDPELVTLKAVRALQSADVILYDDLVDAGVLDLARREARRVAVGKRGGRASVAQADIVAALLAEAAAGLRVVRLKGGDPSVFGRLTEEIDACRAAGVPVEVVPGVTAAFGAAASLGFSLTHRTAATRLQFVTARSPDGVLPRDLNWAALADPGATTAVYMGARTSEAFVARLLAEGLAPETPALLVSAATTPAQSHRRCSLAELPGIVPAGEGEGPLLVIIGAVTA